LQGKALMASEMEANQIADELDAIRVRCEGDPDLKPALRFIGLAIDALAAHAAQRDNAAHGQVLSDADIYIAGEETCH